MSDATRSLPLSRTRRRATERIEAEVPSTRSEIDHRHRAALFGLLLTGAALLGAIGIAGGVFRASGDGIASTVAFGASFILLRLILLVSAHA